MKYKVGENESELVFEIPNIEYTRANNLLIKSYKYTPEFIEYIMKSCGFNDVKIVQFKGAFTKVSVEC